MSWKEKVPEEVLDRIDHERVQPTDTAVCSYDCPSYLSDRCLVTGNYVTSTTKATGTVRASPCAPVFDTIGKRYEKPVPVPEPSKWRREYKVVRGYVATAFNKQMEALLEDGWTLHGPTKFFLRGQKEEVYGVQVLTRTVEVQEDE